MRTAYLLALAASLSLTLAVHPRTSPAPAATLIDLPLNSIEVIGPRCPLTAWSPDTDPNDGFWVLPPSRQVIPYELLQAGYPDRPHRVHDLVVRVTCTAYSSTCDQTDSTPFLTASMQPVGPGIIALSRDLLQRYTPSAPFNFGDHVEIVGVGIFRVEDTMNRRWKRRADIWVKSRADAWQWGRQEVLIGALRPAEALPVLEQNPLPNNRPGFTAELLPSPADQPAQRHAPAI